MDDLCNMMLCHAPYTTDFSEWRNPKDYHYPQKTRNGNMRDMANSKNPFHETGLRLRWHRDFLGLEQREYAEKAKINPKTYSNWETGYAQVSLRGARSLRAAYQLTLDFIIEGVPDALPATLFKAWSETSENR